MMRHDYDEDDDNGVFDPLDEDELIAEILAMEGVEAQEDDLPLDDEVLDEDAWETPPKPTIEEVIDVLKSEDAGSFSHATIVYGLSNISHSHIEEIQETWERIPITKKRAILTNLIESQENDFQLDYSIFAIYNLNQDDPRIRQSAIDLLWEDMSLEIMDHLINLAINDRNRDVRATASSALGRFVLLGELDRLPQIEAVKILEAVMHIWQNEHEDIEVKRRALESLANSSHPAVNPAIESAYNSHYTELQISALYAMGRTADVRWESIILEELVGDDNSKRYEAARAAGELGLISAVQRLAELILDDDLELTTMAIWSLGEIGGKTAMRVLEMLMEQAESINDEAMIEAIEDALGNAMLASELDDLDLFEDD